MENVKQSELFISKVISRVEEKDSLHSRTLVKNRWISKKKFLLYLREIIYESFLVRNVTPEQVADDYLQMIREMRREGVYFEEHGEYSCKSEKEAYEKFYSQKGVMEYYLNALLISQLLWLHHYKMFEFFNYTITSLFSDDEPIRVLDIGAGHGLFSTIIKDTFVDYQKIDIVDISKSSLSFIERILSNDRIEYYQVDLANYRSNYKYDLVILGEVLEHLDSPLDALKKIRPLLKDSGVLFLTVPTNAPALDHIYLFRHEREVFEKIESAKLKIIESHVQDAIDSNTKLVGVFCVK